MNPQRVHLYVHQGLSNVILCTFIQMRIYTSTRKSIGHLKFNTARVRFKYFNKK